MMYHGETIQKNTQQTSNRTRARETDYSVIEIDLRIQHFEIEGLSVGTMQR